MNLSILCFIIFSDIFVRAVAVDQYYQSCKVPRTCGTNQTISFPFYVKGLQEPFCGQPGFELSCNRNGQPVLNLSNEFHINNYIVHQISYQNQSLLLSNAAFSNHSNSGLCIPPLQNLSLPNERFELIPEQDEAYLLDNCHSRRVPNYEIGCSERNETNWVLGLSGNDIKQLGNLSRRCGNGVKVVVAPVKAFSHDSRVGIRELLSRGFELKWKASDCSRCRNSGGLCGFNNSAYIFQCYCPDRPHRVRCDRASSSGFSLKLTL